MQIVDNIVILLLIVLAFIAGKRISDNYHSEQIEYLIFQLRMTAAEKGVGYVAPPVKKKYAPIGQPFMDRLKKTGHATQALRNPPT